jgi:transcriptional regulator with GAF, ATPase, and Fis domain
VRDECTWPPGVINRLRVIAQIFANAIARKIADERLRRTVEAVTALRDRFREESRYLRDELQRVTGTQAVVGHSAAIRKTLEQVRHAAATELPVLLVGETGTGKALLAARIHDLSARREHPMVRVDCAPATALIAGWPSIPETGGLATDPAGHAGPLELARGSTMFFDEVADLSLEAQARLIRVIQDRHDQSPGTPSAGPPVRIIAATRQDLKRCIKEGTFRDDLYYRLSAFPIHVPPLRERPDDIPLLVWRFVDELSATYRRSIDAIDRDSMAALQAYPWPGNARELRNVVERAMIGPPVSRRLRITIPANGHELTRTDGGTAIAARRRRMRGSSAG